jgi:scavenger receptor class B protein 1
VTPLMKLYFFNMTNVEAFLAGRERPKVKKLGPYVYHQEIHKANVRQGAPF